MNMTIPSPHAKIASLQDGPLHMYRHALTVVEDVVESSMSSTVVRSAVKEV